MSSGYMVEFVGGPAHGETHKVAEILRNLRIPIYEFHPLPVTSQENPYAPRAAVYTLIRTPDGEGFYRYCYDEGSVE